MIRLGFHLSIAGSVANAPREAKASGYEAFQIFTTSSRSWKNSTIDQKEAKEFVDHVKGNNLQSFAHIPYLCNPASPNRDVYDKSKVMLVNNLMNCNALGIRDLVIHLGSHLGSGVDVGIDNVYKMLSTVVDSTERVNILLENGAGYNNSVGSKFEQIGKIMDEVDSDRVGLCFDTCHAFAAGYDLRTPEAVDKTVEDLESSLRLSRLRLVHLNDAKHELGSGLDRHWHIGSGNIGIEGFASILSNKLFSSGSFVMEIPDDELASHADDISAVRAIIGALGRT